jgi:hypothetical protein
MFECARACVCVYVCVRVSPPYTAVPPKSMFPRPVASSVRGCVGVCVCMCVRVCVRVCVS